VVRRLSSRRAFSRTSYDEHLVFVAAANLQRAMDRTPRRLRREFALAELESRHLQLLRDVYEHWDQLRPQLRDPTRKLTGAALRLHEEFPKADPWALTFDPATGEITLCDVVSLEALERQIRSVEARIIRYERRIRRDVDQESDSV